MSKKFKIAKRVNHYDIEDFEDVEIEDDFIDENMVQIISDNEYDPMYDDCETIAVALQLAGYGKVADLEAKLAEQQECSLKASAKHSLEMQNAQICIKELEAKLAKYEKFMKDNGFKNLEELDNYIQKIHSYYDEVKNKGTCGLCEKLDNELINQLKQQLAEKDKEIYMKNSEISKLNCTIECFNRMLTQSDALIIAKDQDKISFAVEQLEKVKEELDKHDKIETFVDIYGDSAVNRSDLEFFIDNQIKQLKEME